MTEGVILATASFVGYLLTYAYEVGFASAFGISIQFVEVSLTNVLSVVILFGAAAFIVVGTVSDFLVDLERKGPSLFGRVVNLFFSGFLVLGAVNVFIFRSHGWQWLLAIFAIFSAVIFMLPLFQKSSRGKSYEERFASCYGSRQPQETPRQDDQSGLLARRLQLVHIIGLLLMVVLVGGGVKAGHVWAQDLEQFDVLIDESNTVVLRVYDDKLVTAEFDPCTKEIRHGYSIRTISDSTPVHLRRMRVGPLHFKPTTEIGGDE